MPLVRSPLEWCGVSALADEEWSFRNREQLAAGDLHEFGVVTQGEVERHLHSAVYSGQEHTPSITNRE